MKLELVKPGATPKSREPQPALARRLDAGKGLATSKSGQPVATLSDGRPAWLAGGERRIDAVPMKEWLAQRKRAADNTLLRRLRAGLAKILG